MESTNLSVVERAKNALSLQHTEAELSALAGKFSDVTKISNSDDYALVKGACREFQIVRVSIEKAGKSARDDANLFSKAVIAEQKRLLAIVVPEEDRLKAIRKEVDDRAVRVAAEKLAKETNRKEAIEGRIAYILSFSENLTGMTSLAIEGSIDIVENIDAEDMFFEEYEDKAISAKLSTIKTLESALSDRRELEALRAQQAELQAKADADAEKIRVQQAAIDKERADIEAEKRAEAERKLVAERAKAAKLREEKEELELAERKRVEAERVEAENAKEDLRQESMRPEKDQLRDWLAKLRFIDGVELYDKKLINIQKVTLAGLNELSVKGIQLVDNA